MDPQTNYPVELVFNSQNDEQKQSRPHGPDEIDLENGGRDDGLREEEQQEESPSRVSVLIKTDRERLENVYTHWPIEFSGGSAGVLKNGPLMMERILCTAFAVGVIIYSLVENIDRGELPWWMIYLTNWVLVFNAIHWLLWCTVTYLSLKIPEDDRIKETSAPLVVRIAMWTLHTNLPLNAIISFLYWGLLFPAQDPSYYMLSAWTHAPALLMGIFDAAVSGQKMFLRMWLAPFMFGVAYCIFTAIYWAAGGLDPEGNPIYPQLDWESKPASTTVFLAIVSFVILPFFVCSFWGLSRLWRNRCRTCDL